MSSYSRYHKDYHDKLKRKEFKKFPMNLTKEEHELLTDYAYYNKVPAKQILLDLLIRETSNNTEFNIWRKRQLERISQVSETINEEEKQY